MSHRERDAEKARYWQRTIREAVRSRVSFREFCRRRRLRESQFYWWQRKLKVGREERTLRQARSKPILDDIHTYLERKQPHLLPKSPEGQAIAYTLPNWKALVRHCEDGDLEIHNNSAERSLRGAAISRENWRFLGSDNGGRTATVLTSLIATSKRLGIDPFAYLRDPLRTHQLSSPGPTGRVSP